MKIAVVDFPASKAGALSVLKDFYAYVCDHGQNHEWVFFLGDAQLPETDNIRVLRHPQVKRSWLRRALFDWFKAGKAVAHEAPDVLISLQNLTVRGYLGRQILYVHQPLPFQQQKRFSFFRAGERQLAVYQHIYGRLIARSVRAAWRTVVQTRWMRQELLRKTGVAPERIVVAPNSLPPPLPKRCTLQDGAAVPWKDFFYPASYLLYKNHGAIVEAVRHLKTEGIGGYRVLFTLGEEYRAVLHAEDLDEIHFAGYVAREEIFDMYGKSVLLFPSYIESFGMPLMEARTAGGLILSANIETSLEVCENYPNARFFSPHAPDELARLMKDVLQGRMIYREAGLQAFMENAGWEHVVGLIDQ